MYINRKKVLKLKVCRTFFTRHCIMGCRELDQHLTVLKMKGCGKILSDFQNSVFQKLSMMWASTTFQYFQILSIKILAQILTQTIDVQEVERCSFKGKVLMILTIFKILKIHYKHFWMEFLNKYTLVYSKYVSVKTCIAQKPYLQSKSIDN